MTININTSKPFLNLKDSDLQIMFGILIYDSDSSRQKRNKINKLREKIGKAGIPLRRLGDQEGILINELAGSVKEVGLQSYIPQGKHAVV